MSEFIDRRPQGLNKSKINRQRFIRRHKAQIKKAVASAIARRSSTDIDQGETVHLQKEDLAEPIFELGDGGVLESTHPGNSDYSVGDRLPRPPAPEIPLGAEASNKGEGEDSFAFELSREEFLSLYFDELALPDLIQKEITQIPDEKRVRAGYTTTGAPSNINVLRSMKESAARRIATKAAIKQNIAQTQQDLASLDKTQGDYEIKRSVLKNTLTQLNDTLQTIPFIDSNDLRYNYRIKQHSPATKTVMFCLMDVSGSMDEIKKDIAKRFFILLFLFLERNYDKIALVFIRHHTSAKEVDEEEFFYSRETGGTVVSSALELMHSIIADRYPQEDWNIYAAQASDGDNWNADSPYCNELLTEKILPTLQYYAYIEILPRHHQSLWEAYVSLLEKHENFSMQNIDKLEDIYPVFRELFKQEHPAG